MKRDLTFIAIAIIMLSIVLMAKKSHGEVFIPDTPEKSERLVMAIYKAEGGEKTKYPFGIKSVSCEGYEECKKICHNTVRNNIKRWKDSINKGDDRDYLTFLWHRYAPPKSHKLNKNWKKNVEYFLYNN